MSILLFIEHLTNRLRSYYFNYFIVRYNRAKIRSMGGIIPNSSNINYPCLIKIAEGATFKIGENVTITGAATSNPLNHHKPIINVFKDGYLEIGNGCGLSSPTIWCSKSVIIKDGVGLGGNVLIMDTDAHSLDWRLRLNPKTDKANCVKKGIIIGEKALIGTNSIILKGVTIGAHSVIGAGSVVSHNIPADCVAAGNPCKVIKYFEKNSQQ